MPVSIAERTTIAEDALREASKIKSAVSDAVKDKLWAARQQIRQGRHAAEDFIEDAEHAVKQRPMIAVAIAFATGFLLGLLTRICKSGHFTRLSERRPVRS